MPRRAFGGLVSGFDWGSIRALREAVNYKPRIQWKTPSTLPLHEQQEQEMEMMIRTTPTGYIDAGPADDAIIAAVRASHPQATGYRL